MSFWTSAGGAAAISGGFGLAETAAGLFGRKKSGFSSADYEEAQGAWRQDHPLNERTKWKTVRDVAKEYGFHPLTVAGQSSQSGLATPVGPSGSPSTGSIGGDVAKGAIQSAKAAYNAYERAENERKLDETEARRRQSEVRLNHARAVVEKARAVREFAGAAANNVLESRVALAKQAQNWRNDKDALKAPAHWLERFPGVRWEIAPGGHKIYYITDNKGFRKWLNPMMTPVSTHEELFGEFAGGLDSIGHAVRNIVGPDVTTEDTNKAIKKVFPKAGTETYSRGPFR